VLLGEAAPLAPELGYAAIALGAVLAFCVCWAARGLWQHTAHPFLQWLGDLALHIRIPFHHVTISPFGFAHKLDRQVFNYLTSAMFATERAVVYGMNGMASVFWWTVKSIEHLATGLYHVAAGVGVSSVNTITRTVTKTVAKPILKKLARLEAKAVHIERVIEKDIAKAEAKIKVLASSIAAELPHVGAFGRSIFNLRLRVNKLERKFGALAFAGTVALALAKLGLGFLHCKQVKDAGKKICKLDNGLFNAILSKTDLLVGGFSIVAFVTALLHIEGGLANRLTGFVDELGFAPEDYLVAAEQLLHELESVADIGYEDYLG
jgi:hypothetical protein